MKNVLVVLMILSMMFISCATRQYVIPRTEQGEKPPLKEIGGWSIDYPRLIAYKDVSTLDNIEHPNLFWITLDAHFSKKKRDQVKGDILIDSAAVIIDQDTLWRYPTRIEDFDDNLGKNHHKAFNFYGTQGITIRPSVLSLTLIFFADIKDDQGNTSTSLLDYTMVREDIELNLPVPAVKLRD